MTARLSASQQNMNSKKIINVGAPSDPNDAARKTDVDTAYTNAISRANHVGTQLAATISNFDTQVRTSRLDQMAAPTNPVAFNTQRATGLADPTAPQDSATKAYVDAQLAGLVSGQTLKGAVRVSTNANINISSPGATIDGVNLVAGDVVLLYGQTTGTQNGPYVWNGAAVAMTRAANWDSNAEAVLGSYWIVREGSRADTFAVMSNDTAFTLGTSVLSVVHMSSTPAGGIAFEADIGDGSATAFTLTHNFGTKAVGVVVWRNASPFDEITVYVSRPTVNTVTIEPDEVWSAGQYHAVVWKL
ncbi:putative tail fiber [Mycobacterium phage Myrna]|uniref:Tail fiber n=1 Tax=Mycobacterium phage Myrna TaxID=546805 RepID=B5LJB5_9CAUD|nr:head decoration [Mycobacterium phage Myrna]ACH62112.1 putative tail fiber [Mycobacterium phage Myrna]